MALNPADSAFDRFKAVELNPHTFAYRWALYELDLASPRGSVEDAHSETARARSPEPNFGIKGMSQRAPCPSGIAGVGTHDQVSTRIGLVGRTDPASKILFFQVSSRDGSS